MPVTLYGIKNCDTMKNACAFLDRLGVAYVFLAIKPRVLCGFAPLKVSQL